MSHIFFDQILSHKFHSKTLFGCINDKKYDQLTLLSSRFFNPVWMVHITKRSFFLPWTDLMTCTGSSVPHMHPSFTCTTIISFSSLTTLQWFWASFKHQFGSPTNGPLDKVSTDTYVILVEGGENVWADLLTSKPYSKPSVQNCMRTLKFSSFSIWLWCRLSHVSKHCKSSASTFLFPCRHAHLNKWPLALFRWHHWGSGRTPQQNGFGFAYLHIPVLLDFVPTGRLSLSCVYSLNGCRFLKAPAPLSIAVYFSFQQSKQRRYHIHLTRHSMLHSQMTSFSLTT